MRASIVNVGVGSYRYRVTYSGPGGHSYGSFGMTNPIHALGRLIANIAEFETAPGPKTTFSVGRIGGGTSVNSITHDAWLEVDMRSQDKDALETLHAKFQAATQKALADERARWQDRAPLELRSTRLGYRPAGQTPEDSPAVQAPSPRRKRSS
ncbi:MAG: peptidase dimerization domain-containing protein [Bryobacterales bacterium]